MAYNNLQIIYKAFGDQHQKKDNKNSVRPSGATIRNVYIKKKKKEKNNDGNNL